MRSPAERGRGCVLTPTFRRGSDFRAYVQDSLSAQGKPGAAERAWAPGLP
jgi:hypothetical protein